MTLNDVKISMHFYNLIGRRQHHEVISAVPLLAKKKNCLLMLYCFGFSASVRCFVKDLIETNVNISDDLDFSDISSKCKTTLGH